MPPHPHVPSLPPHPHVPSLPSSRPLAGRVPPAISAVSASGSFSSFRRHKAPVLSKGHVHGLGSGSRAARHGCRTVCRSQRYVTRGSLTGRIPGCDTGSGPDTRAPRGTPHAAPANCVRAPCTGAASPYPIHGACQVALAQAPLDRVSPRTLPRVCMARAVCRAGYPRTSRLHRTPLDRLSGAPRPRLHTFPRAWRRGCR